MDVQKRLEILEKEQADASKAAQENLQARLQDDLAMYEKEGLAEHAARVRAQLEEEPAPKPKRKYTRKAKPRKKSTTRKKK